MKRKELVLHQNVNSLLLITLFALFVCDLTGAVKINQAIQFATTANALEEANPDLTFISASQTNTFEPALVGQDATPKTVNIIKPLIDEREYKYLELPNRLKVLLIHDKNSEMASAALDVKAGSWNEPEAYPGLAHFCEHMLFIGSHKYPDVGYFDDLLAQGGGSSNAYTESTNTNYYLEVTADMLDKSLDAFAHFFIDPLFSEEAVAKERNAVNSEYEIDVNTEEWKVVNLFSLIADPKHPASRFSIGNNDVLAKDGVVDALKQFYQENYSANLMALTVTSSLGLPQMEKMIRSGAFKEISNRNLPQKPFQGLPYQMGQVGKFKSEKKQIIIDWQLSGREEYTHSKPLEFLDYFFSSRHEGGLKDYLVSSGSVIDLETSVFIEEQSFVNYVIELTLPDVELKDGNIAIEMARVVHNFLQTLDEWLKDEKYLKEVFQEQSQVTKINFEYMEGQQETSTLSKNLNKYEPEEVLSAMYVMDKYSREGITKYLGEMKQAERMLILISDNQFDYAAGQDKLKDRDFMASKSVSKRSEIYRLDYDVQKMSKDTIKYVTTKDKKLQQKFSKPQKNEFIPTNLKLISLCEANNDKLPPMVHSEQLAPLSTEDKLNLLFSIGQEMQELNDQDCHAEEQVYLKNNHYPTLLSLESNQWWKISTKFKLPTVFGALQYQFKEYPTLEQFTAVKIYNLVVDDTVEQELNQALQSGYVFNLDVSKKMELRIYGFSEKVRNFFKKICSCMNPFREKSFLQLDDDTKFVRAKQALITSIKEVFQLKLYEQSIQVYLNKLTRKNFHSPEELLQQIPTMTHEQMMENVQKLFGQVNQQSLLLGNIDQTQAREISEDLTKCAAKSFDSKLFPLDHIINLQGQNLVYSLFVQSDQGDVNGATLNYYQIGPRTKQNYAYMKILQPILNQQAYNRLRTDLQLGYVVAMKFKNLGCVDGAILLVQGSKEVPKQVDQLIEDFLGEFDEYISKLGKKEFQHLKKSAITELRQPPQTMTEEGERLWEYISTGDLMFEERHATIELVRKVTRKELAQFYKENFIDKKSKLSIQLYGEAMVSQTLKIKDEDAFKEYVKQNLAQDAQLYEEASINYFECKNEVSSV